MKSPKQCPHLNIVQSGTQTCVETYCTDCNELIKVVTGICKLDIHGDIIMPGAFAGSIIHTTSKPIKYRLLDHSISLKLPQ